MCIATQLKIESKSTVNQQGRITEHSQNEVNDLQKDALKETAKASSNIKDEQNKSTIVAELLTI